MCRQWAQRPGVLPIAGNCGKELLLLAVQVARTNRGVSVSTDGATEVSRCAGGAALHSVPGCGAKAARRCGHGCGGSDPAFPSVAMIDLSKVRNWYISCGLSPSYFYPHLLEKSLHIKAFF